MNAGCQARSRSAFEAPTTEAAIMNSALATRFSSQKFDWSKPQPTS
jgi:hypothetical protein